VRNISWQIKAGNMFLDSKPLKIFRKPFFF